jgi:hypothetical protein
MLKDFCVPAYACMQQRCRVREQRTACACSLPSSACGQLVNYGCDACTAQVHVYLERFDLDSVNVFWLREGELG